MDKKNIGFFTNEDKMNHQKVRRTVLDLYDRLSSYTDIVCRLELDQFNSRFVFCLTHTSLLNDKDPEAEIQMSQVIFDKETNGNIYSELSTNQDSVYHTKTLDKLESHYVHSIIHDFKLHPVAIETVIKYISMNVPGFREIEDNVITKKKNDKLIKTVIENLLKGKYKGPDLKVTGRSQEFKSENILLKELTPIVYEEIKFEYKDRPFILSIRDGFIINIQQGKELY
jgi:hypothetical protein